LGNAGCCKGTTFRAFVKRIPVEKISLKTLEISDLCKTTRNAPFVVRDQAVREALRRHLEEADVKHDKAYPPYPKLGDTGPKIKKVRVLSKRQLNLMAPVSTGYADFGGNHHIAIYRRPDGKPVFEVVSLFEAAQRLTKREPVVRRMRGDGAAFVMSLSPGDAVRFPEGGKKGIWIVQGAWANGQVVLIRNNDARPSTKTEALRLGMGEVREEFRPMISGLLQRRATKISIDPIGRIRNAND